MWRIQVAKSATEHKQSSVKMNIWASLAQAPTHRELYLSTIKMLFWFPLAVTKITSCWKYTVPLVSPVPLSTQTALSAILFEIVCCTAIRTSMQTSQGQANCYTNRVNQAQLAAMNWAGAPGSQSAAAYCLSSHGWLAILFICKYNRKLVTVRQDFILNYD